MGIPDLDTQAMHGVKWKSITNRTMRFIPLLHLLNIAGTGERVFTTLFYNIISENLVEAVCDANKNWLMTEDM